MTPRGPTVRTRVVEVGNGRIRTRPDRVVTEEPMEIRLGWPGSAPRPLVVTMRTPGADFELAAGFLAAERIVTERADIQGISYCTDASVPPDRAGNVVTVALTRPPRRESAPRYAAASAACGVCGTQSLDDLADIGYRRVTSSLTLPADVAVGLPERMRRTQAVFGRTGGLHAAGLFDPAVPDEAVCVREDVGRHNAVDKVVGWSLLAGQPHLDRRVLCVSGRLGYEIVQKAAAAGIPAVVAVGAPSSLAIELADRFGLTLLGFVRDDRFVIYAGAERVVDRPP